MFSECQGALWTPADLPKTDVLGWWDPSVSNYVTESGGAISQIYDKSGNGNHLIQNTGSLQPTYSQNKINGLATMSNTSSGTGKPHMSVALTGIPANHMVISVMRLTTANFSQGPMSIQGGTNGWGWLVGSNDQITTYGGTAGNALDHVDLARPQVFMSSLVFDGDNNDKELLIDGNSWGVQDYNSVTANQDFFLGKNADQSPTYDIGETIFLANDVSYDTRVRVEGYLAWKWGRVSELNALHPYKYYPPRNDIDTIQFWTPDLANVAMWADMSDYRTITESAKAVSQVDSKITGSDNLIQPTGALQPVIDQDKVNNLNVSTHSSQWLEFLNANLGADATVFIVVEHGSSTNEFSSILSYAPNTAGSFQVDRGFTHNPDFDARLRSSTTGSSDETPANGPYNGPSIFTVEFDWNNTARRRYYIDGDQKGDQPYNTTQLLGVGELQVMCNRNQNQFVDGKFCEIVVVKDLINDELRHRIEAYLAHKWGFAANLPVSNPYKDAPAIYNPFTIDNIQGVINYDASDSSTITESAGAVSQWVDKYGNGSSLSQNSGSSQPLINSRTLDSKPVMDFNGTTHHFNIDNLFDFIGYELFILGQIDDHITNNKWFGGSGNIQIGVVPAGSPSEKQMRLWRGDDPWDGDPYHGTEVTELEPGFFTYRMRTDNRRLRYNGDETVSGIYDNPKPFEPNEMGRGQFSPTLSGFIAEVVMIPEPEDPDDDIINKIEGLLAWKWNEFTKLGLTHPYRFIRPEA